MPAAFSTVERDRITGLLLETGQHLFTTQGLRKTSLDDLVRPAGIAKSSFYTFFDAKESLYLELVVRQLDQIKTRVIDDGLLAGSDLRDGLRRFLHATVAELASNPLYRRLMTHPEEMRAVARRVDAQRLAAVANNPMTALTDYLTHSSADLTAEPAVVVGVLQAVLFVPMHAEDLGAAYPQILDLLIDLVAAGLTSKDNA